MENKDLLKDLEKAFEKSKQELGFKSSFEDIEEIFFIKDFVLERGFVSEKFSRQLASRILDTYNNWVGYLHGLLMPNPQNMLNIHESNLFDDDAKKQLSKLLTKCLALTSTNTVVGLTNDKQAEGKFIDESVDFWKTSFEKDLTDIILKVNDSWKKDSLKEE